jgi:hypothetical protein
MTRDETKDILAVLKAGYPNFYKDMTKEDAKNIVSLWATMFSDEKTQIVTEAVKSLICTLKFPPTIADVKEKIAMITQPQEMTEMEAWGLVRKALNHYNARENFKALPETIKKIIGSPNTLREWAMMDIDKVETVIQSNFMRSYKIKTAQKRSFDMLPNSTKKLIAELSQKFMNKKSIAIGGDKNDKIV